MPVIVAAVAALYGAYAQRRSQQEKQRAQSQAIDLANRARKQSASEMGASKMYKSSEWMFPGLLAPPPSMVKHQEAIEKYGAKAKTQKAVNVWQHQENKVSQDINPWEYLQQKGQAGTPAPLPSSPGGVPLSTPMGAGAGAGTGAGAGAVPHGGTDPTTLPTDIASNATPTPITPQATAAPGAIDTATPSPTTTQIGGGAVQQPITSAPTPSPTPAPTPAPTAGPGYGQDTMTPKQQRQANRREKKQAAKDKARNKITRPFVPAGDTSRQNQIYPGQLVQQHLMNLLQNPGQLESTTYERAQEQSNEGLNAMVAQSMGSLTGLGIDPRSGIGQVVQESGVLNFAKERNEAARDYSLAKEDLRRRDIQEAMTDYTNFLSTVMGLQKSKSQAKAPPGEMWSAYPGAAGGAAAATGAAAQGVASAVGGMGSGGASAGGSTASTGGTAGGGIGGGGATTGA